MELKQNFMALPGFATAVTPPQTTSAVSADGISVPAVAQKNSDTPDAVPDAGFTSLLQSLLVTVPSTAGLASTQPELNNELLMSAAVSPGASSAPPAEGATSLSPQTAPQISNQQKSGVITPVIPIAYHPAPLRVNPLAGMAQANSVPMNGLETQTPSDITGNMPVLPAISAGPDNVMPQPAFVSTPAENIQNNLADNAARDITGAQNPSYVPVTPASLLTELPQTSSLASSDLVKLRPVTDAPLDAMAAAPEGKPGKTQTLPAGILPETNIQPVSIPKPGNPVQISQSGIAAVNEEEIAQSPAAPVAMTPRETQKPVIQIVTPDHAAQEIQTKADPKAPQKNSHPKPEEAVSQNGLMPSQSAADNRIANITGLVEAPHTQPAIVNTDIVNTDISADQKISADTNPNTNPALIPNANMTPNAGIMPQPTPIPVVSNPSSVNDGQQQSQEKSAPVKIAAEPLHNKLSPRLNEAPANAVPANTNETPASGQPAVQAQNFSQTLSQVSDGSTITGQNAVTPPATPDTIANDAGITPAPERQEMIRSATAQTAPRIETQQHAASPPIRDIAVHISQHADTGANRFQLRLDPPELGRVDVRMEISAEGKLSAVIAVERPETLDLLQRDQRVLERSLADAGLKTDAGSLSFTLKDGRNDGRQEAGEQPAFKENNHPSADDWDDGSVPVHTAMRFANSAVNIRI